MKLLIGVFAFCLMALHAAAQKGSVEVNKDPRIDSLIARRIELSKGGANGQVNGYRIQIFSGTGRQEAYTTQTEFKSLHPDVKSYISYVQPNYKVRVGDFRTRLEAEKLMNQLKQYFTVLFVIPQAINPK